VQTGLWLKPAVFAAALAPAVVLLVAAFGGNLGPDPAEALMHGTGEWAARLLIATLLISPLREIGGWKVLLKLRRMLGLFVFAYGSVHLLLFLQFYLGWSGARVWEELVERPYIAVGFLAWVLMLPLAVTSTRGMQRRLKRNWARLHRAIYPVALLVSLHILWQARSDVGEALVYIAIFALLLGWRALRYRRRLAA
jgi:sulfoxide reductase heme-binding subunit YedZ